MIYWTNIHSQPYGTGTLKVVITDSFPYVCLATKDICLIFYAFIYLLPSTYKCEIIPPRYKDYIHQIYADIRIEKNGIFVVLHASLPLLVFLNTFRKYSSKIEAINIQGHFFIYLIYSHHNQLAICLLYPLAVLTTLLDQSWTWKLPINYKSYNSFTNVFYYLIMISSIICCSTLWVPVVNTWNITIQHVNSMHC